MYLKAPVPNPINKTTFGIKIKLIYTHQNWRKKIINMNM